VPSNNKISSFRYFQRFLFAAISSVVILSLEEFSHFGNHGAIFANGSWRLIPKNTILPSSVSFFPLHLLFVAFLRTHDSFLYIDAG
jgi:hypothetical protein